MTYPVEIRFYRRLTGCKTPTSGIRGESRIISGGSTASKSAIGSTNNQWGKYENPHCLKFHFIFSRKSLVFLGCL